MSDRALRAWLLSDTPASRRQAAWGRRYRLWLALRANPLALAGLAILALALALALFAPWIAAADPGQQDLAHRLAPPSAAHWLGTDELGRDIWSRLVHGGRLTLGMVVAVVILTVPLGVILGCIAGYAGGALDAILMRLTDVFLAFPRLVLALALVAALKPGVESAVIAIALTAWPSYARLARAESLRLREADFIVALRLAGASRWRIVLHHILPLAVPSAIVRTSLDMSSIVLTAAGLGFLGLGAQPPLPEWGTMISTGRSYLLEQWWVPAAPGLAILLVSLAFNLLGDGLRDALDPKQR